MKKTGSQPELHTRTSRLLPGWLIGALDRPRHDRRSGLSGFLQHVYRSPSNEAEASCHREILDKGHLVIRGGWPDFMVLCGPDEIFVVEVKGPGDTLKDHQIVVLELLARAGINTYVRWDDHYEAIGNSIPWQER